MSGGPDHARYMAAALRLGRRGLGLTAPNPAVGCLVVRHEDGTSRIAGAGFTQPGGRPHAEVMALRQAGAAAQGATLYVSLEPCAHTGKSPPCTQAIIAAGVGHVVSAMQDPNPRVRGKGHEGLREAGIEVTGGMLEGEARWLSLGHICLTTLNRPFVQLKLAHSADGMIAGPDNATVQITGEIAAGWTHRLRAEADAVLVGVSTVLADDPLLTCRLPGADARSPVRLVLDSHLRTPLHSRLVKSAAEVPVWIGCSESAPRGRGDDLAAAGVELIRCPLADDGRISARAFLARLAARGISRLLVEGGAKIVGAFLLAGLADEVILFKGTVAIGAGGMPAFGARTGMSEGEVPGMALVAERLLGKDRMQVYRKDI